MYKCAFLTTDNLGTYAADDQLAYKPLLQLNWHVEPIAWRKKGIDWQQFDAIVIRSTWDYHNYHEQFIDFLDQVTQSGLRLANPVELVKWNANKSYLLELHKKEVLIVPTIAGSGLTNKSLMELFDKFETNELVIKPIVGANAKHTYRISKFAALDTLSLVSDQFQDREYLAQPFVNSIVSEGEYSLMFFNGEYSHAIVKAPAPQDFRVQEFYGGTVNRFHPDQNMVNAAKKSLSSLPQIPLYCRVDLVQIHTGDLALMELELIEPNLYFRMDADAPDRFAKAFLSWLEQSFEDMIIG